MTIVVTGATGFVGRAIVEQLSAAGERPRCLVRDAAKAAQSLPAAKVDFVEGNILHAATLDGVFKEGDILMDSSFMTANLKQHGEETYYNVNVDGTANLIAAAKRAGVTRAVVMSGLGTKADKPGSYMQGRYLAEEAFKESGLGWAILQPSVQFGKGSAFFKGLADLIKGVPLVVPIAGTGKETFQPIWVDDVARIAVMCLNDPQYDGQSYPLGGPEIFTYAQILDHLMATLHVKKTKIPGPKPFVMLGAAVMEAVLPKPPITTAALGLFDFPNTTTLDSVAKPFGFAPQSWLTYMQANGAD
ncbi:MAG: NAD(P)H-binding protein [Ktedonobacterales bacterium]|nr:NAD(P)H-binding protein [Ktedonobacterales bacterium]